MSTIPLQPQPNLAEIYDSAMRFLVPSRTRPHISHVVDLDCYDMNGKCSCKAFQFELEPLLSRNITPEAAIASGAVKLKRKGKPEKRPEDALRCDHIIDGYIQFGHVAARAISYAKKKNTTASQERDCPF